MRSSWQGMLFGPGLLAILLAAPARADDGSNIPSHTLERAGHPDTVACYAVPSDTGAYVGYPVGGGCAVRCCGDGPHPQEGTWGWDYRGRCFPRRVFLLWWHGRCSQGGPGQYQPEGPVPLCK